mgnify:FL=1
MSWVRLCQEATSSPLESPFVWSHDICNIFGLFTQQYCMYWRPVLKETKLAGQGRVDHLLRCRAGKLQNEKLLSFLRPVSFNFLMYRSPSKLMQCWN